MDFIIISWKIDLFLPWYNLHYLPNWWVGVKYCTWATARSFRYGGNMWWFSWCCKYLISILIHTMYLHVLILKIDCTFCIIHTQKMYCTSAVCVTWSISPKCGTFCTSIFLSSSLAFYIENQIIYSIYFNGCWVVIIIITSWLL